MPAPEVESRAGPRVRLIVVGTAIWLLFAALLVGAVAAGGLVSLLVGGLVGLLMGGLAVTAALASTARFFKSVRPRSVRARLGFAAAVAFAVVGLLVVWGVAFLLIAWPRQNAQKQTAAIHHLRDALALQTIGKISFDKTVYNRSVEFTGETRGYLVVLVKHAALAVPVIGARLTSTGLDRVNAGYWSGGYRGGSMTVTLRVLWERDLSVSKDIAYEVPTGYEAVLLLFSET